jgi:hypothetical protein
MAKAKVLFRELIQDSQEYGSNDEHMISRVFFDLEIDGVRHEGLYANVKQAVGSSFESAPLEVSSPTNYKGPFNFEAFRDAVEGYYRGLVGSQGSGIRISGGSNIRMKNNRFVSSAKSEFEV